MNTMRRIPDHSAAAAIVVERLNSVDEHADRVALLSAAIATEMGLPEAVVNAIRECAAFHDIGKIAVPAEILWKPGPLTDAEMAIVREHAVVGGVILSSAGLLRTAVEIALTHHERWDGSGYPSGLQGNSIPLSGRIVGVADVYDALTSVRPYKEAWPQRRALAEIIQNKGILFDPAVVDALVRVVLRHTQPMWQETFEAA